MIYRLYDLILCLSALVLIPYYLLRGLRHGRVRRGIRERLGFFDPELLKAVAGKQLIWVHAVSVGETRAAIPMLKALRQGYPEHVIIISNVTETGREVASKIKEVDHCIFFPFDLSWVVRKVLKRFQPKLIILVETEIWPNFVGEAKRRGIPVVLVNGRISDRSFPRYRKAGKLLESVISGVTSFCMQSAQDGRRIRHLGAPSGRVQVTGNMKFDMAVPDLDTHDPAQLRRHFNLPPTGLLWVAGSTHTGEEEILVDVYRRLQNDYPDLFMVLVPRHPERARSLHEELQKRDMVCYLRTLVQRSDTHLQAGELLIVDTLGEMLKLYSIADLVFVGGSMVPVGGHNVLEASLVKKPVLYGPYMQNFKEIARLLKAAHGGLQVKSGDDLHRQVRLLFDNPDEAGRIGDNGYRLLAENRGATARTIDEIGRRILRLMGAYREAYVRMLQEGPATVFEKALWLVLRGFSLLYATAIRLRRQLYRFGIRKIYRAGVPVISVGNLTMGGTGKTPLVDHLLKRLCRAGLTPAVVSRGYGGSYQHDVGLVSAGDGRIKMTAAECGDEPWLLAHRNPSVRVYVARRRRLGVMAAENDGVDAVILDDGFQHLAVARDLDILLLDARSPFGNGSMVPAGPLREPLEALDRADLVVMTRAEPGQQYRLPTTRPPLACYHQLGAHPATLAGEPVDWGTLDGQRGLAFAGIARPVVFFAALKDQGLDITTEIAFVDHQEYTSEVLSRLGKACHNHDFMITTEKDAVKLSAASFPLPCYQVAVEIAFADDAELVSGLRGLFKEAL